MACRIFSSFPSWMKTFKKMWCKAQSVVVDKCIIITASLQPLAVMEPAHYSQKRWWLLNEATSWLCSLLIPIPTLPVVVKWSTGCLGWGQSWEAFLIWWKQSRLLCPSAMWICPRSRRHFWSGHNELPPFWKWCLFLGWSHTAKNVKGYHSLPLCLTWALEVWIISDSM